MTDATPPVHVPHHGGSNLTGSLGHKLGPLPVWAWGLIGGLAFGTVYYLHRRKALAQAQAAPTGSAFTSLGANSNGGDAGELATTGGSSGLGGTAAGTSLAQWAANAVNWLIGQGTDPGAASNALSAYINGSTLTTDQAGLVNKALSNFGAPPSGILPVNTTQTNQAPAGDPNALKSNFPGGYTRNAADGAIYGIKADGTQVHLTPAEYAALGNPSFTPYGTAPKAPAAPAKATAPAAPAKPAVATRTYRVMSGDTYYSIAGKFYGSSSAANVAKLEGANPYPARSIPVGATLKIPA